MKFIVIIIQGIAVYYLSVFITNAVIGNNYLYIIVLFLAFLYWFCLSWDKKFILFSLIVFFPFVFPAALPFRTKMMVEFLGPFLCFLLIIDIVSKNQSFFSRKASLHLTAIGVIALWSILNYIKTPVSGLFLGIDKTLVKGVYAGGGLRDYFLIFVGITVFLSTFWFFRYKKLNVEKWFIILLVLSLFLGNFNLFGIFKMLSIPSISFLKGFGGDEVRTGQYASVGGLRTLGMLGVPVFLSLIHNKKLNLFYLIILCNLILFSFFAGGRAAFYGVVIAVIVYATLVSRKSLVFLIPLVLILFSIYGMFYSNIVLSEHKYGRVFLIQGGVETQDKPRHYAFKYMWEVFKNYPILGKGINYRDIGIHDKFIIENPGMTAVDRQHVETQLGGGGHGSYFSIVSNFGIGGAFFFSVMLFGSMYYAFKIFKNSVNYDDNARLVLFCFLFLIIQSVRLYVGGTGTDKIEPWFLAGLVAGIKARDQLKVFPHKKHEDAIP
jgi:hypothetical protein